jgi:MoxR-like ATPase
MRICERFMKPESIQRPPVEQLYAAELAQLAKEDATAPKPAGWWLSPASVLAFVLGDPKRELTPKFVGSRPLVERAIVSLATNRGLMLIGEPGTAKSYLSELLAAAISGDSTLVVQGTAGVTEDSIKYSWNYALLLAEGPGPKALVSAPVHRGMLEGRIVRFEEITRCPLEIQDTLLSILSERMMAVPELPAAADRNVFARPGFNIIATANTRDRGVNEMSAALKRRFNFETIPPIAGVRHELELVKRETDRLLAQAGIPAALPTDIAELIVTTFQDLRSGKTVEGAQVEPLTTVMSTAEAVGVAFSSMAHAHYYDGGAVRPRHLVHALLGSALKDAPEDAGKLRHYFNHAVKSRSGKLWREYYEAREALP